VQLPSQIYDVNFKFSAQYAKKNGVHRSRSMVAILVVSIGLLLLLVVSIAYWLVTRKKKGKEICFTLYFFVYPFHLFS
jgi:membrane-anchored glycerophosphoryl diester phosphodiesterase (GDPDase)